MLSTSMSSCTSLSPQRALKRRHNSLATLVALVALVASVMVPTAKAQASCGGVSFPPKTTAFGIELKRNGMGIRTATFLNVHVYVAALYAEHPSRKVAALLKETEPKVMLMHFKRDVDRDELVDALKEAVRNNAPSEYKKVLPHLTRFAKRLPQLVEGTRLTLAYRPGHGLDVSVNGRSRGVEADDHFGNLVFRSFLGPKPPDEDLKVGLMGGPCNG